MTSQQYITTNSNSITATLTPHVDEEPSYANLHPNGRTIYIRGHAHCLRRLRNPIPGCEARGHKSVKHKFKQCETNKYLNLTAEKIIDTICICVCLCRISTQTEGPYMY